VQAASVCEAYVRLDALLNNAAVLSSERTITEDGQETRFQVNHLGSLLLTNLLRAPLIAAAPSRVVTVSSDAHFYTLRGIRFEDLGYERGWTSFGSYAHSKLANVMFAYELADRWAGSGVTSNAVHPGPVRSGLGRDGWGVWGTLWDNLIPKRSPRQAGEDVAWVVEAPQVEGASGLYYYHRAPKRASRPSYDRRARQALWTASATLTGLDGSEAP
jgi:NAD(P)-dependent dehydrogenase (short-subunit alcohol dehydrogenase family)